ncbi:hypothetical protein E2C01_064353 [Portunus trituberculatus]|uniref:Uncharacterized protein n=1 Tax=Portunus trituberculatus TaxID=210409 RepID=A0A5B7HNJ1_PORTR|nr:hypothetical protein [Portunus trituberculatus]
MEKYIEGIMKHVPMKKIDQTRHKVWFNRRCELARMERGKVWNRWRRNRRQNNRNE